MSLKDRLKFNSESRVEEMIISSPIIKESFAGEIFNEILKQDCNILVYCDINIPTYRAINYICSKIENDKRLVGIGSNLLLNPDEIIKFEPEAKNQSKELIKTAISLHPYKIVLQDFDGVEAVDIFKLVNAGIKNVICAVNAKTPQKALRQIEMNLYMNGVQIPQTLMRNLIADFVDKIVYVEKFNDGYIIKNIYNTEIGKDDLYVISELIKNDKEESTKIKTERPLQAALTKETVKEDNIQPQKIKTEKPLQAALTKKTAKEDNIQTQKTKTEKPLQTALTPKTVAEKPAVKKEKKQKTEVVKKTKKRNILAAKLKKKKINKK